MRKSDAIILCIFLVVTACGMRNKSLTGNPDNDLFPRSVACFSPVRENPVFGGTGSGTWDRKIRERDFILYEDRIYKMWYSGYNPDRNKKIMLGYTTSSDGIKWTRYPGNPIIDGDYSSPILVFDGEKPSLYTMHPQVCRYITE